MSIMEEFNKNHEKWTQILENGILVYCCKKHYPNESNFEIEL